MTAQLICKNCNVSYDFHFRQRTKRDKIIVFFDLMFAIKTLGYTVIYSFAFSPLSKNKLTRCLV